MKTRIITYLWDALAALTAIVFAGCREEMSFNGADNSAAALIAPEDGAAVELFNSSVASLDFEWKAGSTGAPYYSIVFYNAEGVEISRIAAQGRIYRIAVPHTDLNKAAALAGIAPSGEGSVQWAVAAVNGTNEIISQKRTLTLKSYRSFDDLPAALYVTGAGSEGGSDLAAAAPFRIAADGSYEVFTKLKAGEPFYFTNRNASGAARRFFLTAAGSIAENADSSMTVAAEGIYRIRINFAGATGTVVAVENVEYFNAGTSTATPMSYSGYGKWTLEALNLGALTGDNNKYKFTASIGGMTYSLGCNTSGGQSAPPQTLEGNYFQVYQNAHDPANPARYTYKYMTELADCDVTLTLNMGADGDYYSHSVDVGDLTVYPVAALAAPAADASVALSKVAGSTLDFSWTASAGTRPVPKYRVVFYSDAAGTQQIGEVEADNSGTDPSATIAHNAMETVAAAAGIAAEGTGDIYWSVKTLVLTNSALATADGGTTTLLRKLTITRLPGIPAACYITGEASEGGAAIANALPMKRTTDGIFEIYTRLTNTGTYHFTDGTGAQHRIFSVTSGNTAIQEGGTSSSSATAVYKIVLNFNTDVATYSEVTLVQFHLPNPNTLIALDYDGNGVWSKTVVNPTTNTDDRYRFKVTSGGVRKDWIGIGQIDRAPNASEQTNPSAAYWHVQQGTLDTQWGSEDRNIWKRAVGSWQNTFEITFSLNAADEYHHSLYVP